MAKQGEAITVVVKVTIKEDRLEEFLQVMMVDVEGSRQEPGCLRFDLLRASSNKFFFYEAYINKDAVDFHKTQPHYKVWEAFKESGGVISAEKDILECIDFQGGVCKL
jgi:autoinducer 2-degrading protein